MTESFESRLEYETLAAEKELRALLLKSGSYELILIHQSYISGLRRARTIWETYGDD